MMYGFVCIKTGEVVRLETSRGETRLMQVSGVRVVQGERRPKVERREFEEKGAGKGAVLVPRWKAGQ